MRRLALLGPPGSEVLCLVSDEARSLRHREHGPFPSRPPSFSFGAARATASMVREDVA